VGKVDDYLEIMKDKEQVQTVDAGQFYGPLQLVYPEPQWRGASSDPADTQCKHTPAYWDTNPEHRARINGAYWMWDEEEGKLVPDRDTCEADLDL
jgi:hypothetical protein